MASPPSPLTLTTASELLIVLRKRIYSTRNLSPHYTALSFHILSQSFCIFLSSIHNVSIPKFVGHALAHLGWCQAMFDEISVNQNGGT